MPLCSFLSPQHPGALTCCIPVTGPALTHSIQVVARITAARAASLRETELVSRAVRMLGKCLLRPRPSGSPDAACYVQPMSRGRCWRSWLCWQQWAWPSYACAARSRGSARGWQRACRCGPAAVQWLLLDSTHQRCAPRRCAGRRLWQSGCACRALSHTSHASVLHVGDSAAEWHCTGPRLRLCPNSLAAALCLCLATCPRTLTGHSVRAGFRRGHCGTACAVLVADACGVWQSAVVAGPRRGAQGGARIQQLRRAPLERRKRPASGERPRCRRNTPGGRRRAASAGARAAGAGSDQGKGLVGGARSDAPRCRAAAAEPAPGPGPGQG